MTKLIMTCIGWLGVLLCTLGYLLLSLKVIKAESWTFQLFNVVGGLCLAMTALDTSDLPNAAANLLWMSIGIYALGRQLTSRKRTKAA
ncbi:CBU_0592 family membrane protein [Pedobacter soli]|nr:hypothetical protein [Pedobacter soli]